MSKAIKNRSVGTRGYFFALLILAFLSAVTSGIGLWTIFSKSSNEYLAIIFAVMITGALQLFIVLSWKTAFRDFGFVARALSIAAGFCLAIVSGLLASGSYNFMFNGAAYQSYLNIQEKYTVERPVIAVQNYLDDFSGMMINFAQESKSLAVIESSAGGTCDGDRPRVGDGPRTRLRNRMSAETRNKATDASGVVRELNVVLSDVRKAVTDRDYIESYSAARSLLKDHRIRGIESWLGKARNSFSSDNGWYDAESKKYFDCKDKSFVRVIDDALRILAAAPALPDRPPSPQVFSFRESLFKSYQDAFSLLLEYIGAKSSTVTDELVEQRKYSYIGYFCGLFVEFLIFLMSVIIAAIEKRSGRQINTLDMVLSGGRKRDQQDVDILYNVLHSGEGKFNEPINFILELIYSIGKEKFLIVPVDGNKNSRLSAKRYAALFKLRCERRELYHWPIDKLNSTFVESRAEILGGTTVIDLYPISLPVLDQIESLVRDAALAGSDFNVDPPEPDKPDPSGAATDDEELSDEEENGDNVVSLNNR